MIMIALSSFAQEEHVHSMAMQDVSVMDGFNIVPEFQLTDHLGNTIDQSILDNNYTLVGFGFTNCPDVCPLMAFNMVGMASVAIEFMVTLFVKAFKSLVISY